MAMKRKIGEQMSVLVTTVELPKAIITFSDAMANNAQFAEVNLSPVSVVAEA